MCLFLMYVYEKDAFVSDKVFNHAIPSVQKALLVSLPGTSGAEQSKSCF